MFRVIEDCSPYYIRFEFNNVSKIIDICNAEMHKNSVNVYDYKKLTFTKLDTQTSNTILSLLPFAQELKLNPSRVTLFTTHSKGFSNIHKDGLDHRVSFNIGIKILDSKCVTSWWSDSDMSKFEFKIIDKPAQKSRHLINTDTTNIIPIKTRTAIQGEFILFNTDIYHSWNNNSDNERIVLTMRSVEPANLYFDDAKEILLKYI